MAAGYGVNSYSFALIALRGEIPDLLSITLANVLLVAGYAFYALGLQRFLQQRLNWLAIWAPVILIGASYPFVSSIEYRIVITGLVNVYQVALLLRLVLRSSARLAGRGKYILMTAFVLGIATALSRPLAIGLGLLEIDSITSPGSYQTLTFLPILLLNVAVALGVVLMQKEHAEAATSFMARSDDLTGLPNRRSIYECINQVMLDNERKRVFGALLLIDLNNFKTVNDQYGHAIGDELLRQAAGRIKSCVGERDIAARLGGDEFVVLLTDLGAQRETAINAAHEHAACIQQTLDQPYRLKPELEHRSSGSIGIAIFEPGARDREALLREADQAMYHAKNARRLSTTTTPAPHPAASE